LGSLGATYTVHLRLIRELLVDFLFVLRGDGLGTTYDVHLRFFGKLVVSDN